MKGKIIKFPDRSKKAGKPLKDAVKSDKPLSTTTEYIVIPETLLITIYNIGKVVENVVAVIEDVHIHSKATVEALRRLARQQAAFEQVLLSVLQVVPSQSTPPHQEYSRSESQLTDSNSQQD